MYRRLFVFLIPWFFVHQSFANCTGSGSIKTCYDTQTGNSYTVSEFGNSTYVTVQTYEQGTHGVKPQIISAILPKLMAWTPMEGRGIARQLTSEIPFIKMGLIPMVIHSLTLKSFNNQQIMSRTLILMMIHFHHLMTTMINFHT